MYKTIFKYMLFISLFSLILSSSAVLYLLIAEKVLNDFPAVLKTCLFSAAAMAVCFFAAKRVSVRLKDKIVGEIDNISVDGFDENKFPFGELSSFITRISEQNAEITRQMERVKRQKLRLQAVSESMSEGLIVLDRDGNILSVNASAMSFFGMSGKEKVKKTGIMSLIDKNEVFADNIIKALHNEKGSFYHKIADKTYEVFYSPVADGDKVMGVVMLMFDMTERVKNEQIRTEFTANVSHELKTPLTSIHGYAQLLSGGMVKPEDTAVFAGKIEKESRRLIALVEDIIELSNLDEGSENVKSNFKIMPMLTEIADNLKINAERRSISITIEGEDFEVFADSLRIHELLYNIADNAVKYNKENGNVTITVSKGTVTIADTGIGIPEEYCDRVFERFFRVDKSHSKTVNGTGLGLSIVKHIAMNNSIKIELKSKLGEGTVFKIIFP